MSLLPYRVQVKVARNSMVSTKTARTAPTIQSTDLPNLRLMAQQPFRRFDGGATRGTNK